MKVRSQRARRLAAILFALLATLDMSARAAGNTIRLPNRTFTPGPGIEVALSDKLDAQGRARVFGILQMQARVTQEHRTRLAARGIELRQFLGGTTYIAEFAAQATAMDVRDLLQNLVRWAGDYRPDDKLDRPVFDRRFDNWVELPDGRVLLSVRFQDGTSLAEAERFLSGLTRDFLRFGIDREWAIALPRADIDVLAAEESVLRVSQGPEASRGWFPAPSP